MDHWEVCIGHKKEKPGSFGISYFTVRLGQAISLTKALKDINIKIRLSVATVQIYENMRIEPDEVMEDMEQ